MLCDHVSDTHGYFPTLSSKADIIIHSGDLCPNQTRGNREIEVPFQLNWIKNNLLTFKDWIGDRPFIFCRGNHDFYPDICKSLQEGGINAIDITSKKAFVYGMNFYGFPFIPYIEGEWNGECTSNQMQKEVHNLKDVLETSVDILVTHCPPYGILDASFVIPDPYHQGQIIVPDWAEHFGNTHLTNLFSYNLDSIFYPKYLLCGHIHTHHSITEEFGIKISNAATTVHHIEIEL